jgi:hypothetical protein
MIRGSCRIWLTALGKHVSELLPFGLAYSVSHLLACSALAPEFATLLRRMLEPRPRRRIHAGEALRLLAAVEAASNCPAAASLAQDDSFSRQAPADHPIENCPVLEVTSSSSATGLPPSKKVRVLAHDANRESAEVAPDVPSAPMSH